ncbi:hypothetical protein [Pediococcus acidilactici]|uniref:Uncharacterized protein n=1 Tax=Pediococcus acidilactici DSM 20284 TaxID=862514 RepID=E0NDA1_PEDAC|nr:hypothetical protein [Pediococcus acidilactici]AZP90601.1 hypothetical protein CYD95_04290 [Pediococcus acidilactici]EFL96222.1 hypothetical protein HMPREF0623_0273 [Pediococcus acidilactici DSM 20284]KRN17137.1 hypothetical protein IV78_GL000222 [Pediococcus acidilactici]MBM6602844.1 hypothetical protein [Pediococcus acidilactici]MDG9739573.1 hypothetical protein [Pediococcus acidilactici]
MIGDYKSGYHDGQTDMLMDLGYKLYIMAGPLLLKKLTEQKLTTEENTRLETINKIAEWVKEKEETEGD